VLGWRLSNTMDVSFCLAALEDALARFGRPEIFNTDQGSQFTSAAFTGALAESGVAISMDGRGRWMDNVFIERLWRSLKCEDVYLKGYASGPGSGAWDRRPHQALAGPYADGCLARGDRRRQGCGHNGQRVRVAHMPSTSTADAAPCCVIERNPEQSRFQLRTCPRRSRCAGPFQMPRGMGHGEPPPRFATSNQNPADSGVPNRVIPSEIWYYSSVGPNISNVYLHCCPISSARRQFSAR
jgi:hypothetical protein